MLTYKRGTGWIEEPNAKEMTVAYYDSNKHAQHLICINCEKSAGYHFNWCGFVVCTYTEHERGLFDY